MAVVALLTLLSVVVLRQQAGLERLRESTSAAALDVARVNGLIYAVALSSHRVLMSADIASAKGHADGLIAFTDEIGRIVGDWERQVRDDDAVVFARFRGRIQKLVNLRQEVGRRALDRGPAVVRSLIDEESIGELQSALNTDLRALSDVYAQRSSEVARLSERWSSTSWLLMFVATSTLAMVAIVAWLVHRSILRPLTEITDAVRTVAEGRYVETVPHSNRLDEIGALSGAIEVFRNTMLRNEVLVAASSAAAREHEAIEDEMHLHKQHLDCAVNNINQGLLLLDAERRVILCNEKYLRMYSLSREAVTPGIQISGLLQLQKRAGTYVGDPEIFVAWMTSRSESSGDLKVADGRVISIHNRPIPDGWVSTHQDVTEQRRAARALECTERFLATVIESVPQAIVVKDARELRYLLLNRAAERLFGVSRSGILGKTARDVFPEATAALIESHDRILFSSNDTFSTKRHVIETPGNGRQTVSVRRFLVNGNGSESNFVLSVIEAFTDPSAENPRHVDRNTDAPVSLGA